MTKAIEVKNLTKEFLRGQKPKQSLREIFVNPFSNPEMKKFKAVNDMSFDVERGEFFGIIGRNGSGKSTLLKLLAGIIDPTEGSLNINGRLVPFLELGVGFNPDLTARENVFLNGTILGMKRRFLESKFDEIIKFAEIEDFVDTQLKNFSSGMQVRLAFAIAIQADAEIYLIDEILAVGDFAFQQKCFNLFRQMKKEGKTFVFVSHDLGTVREFCDRAMYIKGGEIKAIGKTVDIVSNYIINDRRESGAQPIKGNIFDRDTEEGGKMEIKLLDESGKETVVVPSNGYIKIRVNYELSPEALKEKLVIGFGIYKDGDNFIFGTNSLIEDKQVKFEAKGTTDFVIKNFDLLHGHYGISAAIHSVENNHYVWKDNAVEFDVVKTNPRDGLVDIDVEIQQNQK